MEPQSVPTPATIESEVGLEVYQELLAAFLGQLPCQLVELSAAAASGDVPAARYVAHQIKGTASSFGAVGLDQLADRVFWVGRGDGASLRSLVDKIEAEITRLLVVMAPTAAGAGQADAVQPVEVAAGDGVWTLERDLGPDMFRELLAAFVADLPLRLAALNDAAAIGDVLAARYTAHQIKGSASSFGAVALDELADSLLRVRKGQIRLLRSLVAQVGTEIAHLQTVSRRPDRRNLAPRH